MIKAILKSARTKLGTEGPAFVDVNSSISYSTELGFYLAVDGLDNFPPVISYSGILWKTTYVTTYTYAFMCTHVCTRVLLYHSCMHDKYVLNMFVYMDF